MKQIAVLLITALIVSGCNMGHPVKTTDDISESDLIGTFKYNDEYVIELQKNGKGVQEVAGKIWSLSNNEIILSDLIAIHDGKIEHYGEQTYIISNDYRDYH